MNLQSDDPAWKLARVGKVTASRVADLLATTKTGWGASRAAYATTLIVERLTGLPAPSFETPEMRWGRETEPQARAIYQFDRDVEVVEVGFVPHPTIENAGASPDGLIGEEGLLEIKAPSSHHHLEILLTGTIPSRYMQQMYFQGACTGRKWADFMSFDPRMPENLQCFVKRVVFDPSVTLAMENDVRKFLAEIDDKLARLKGSYTFRGEAA